MTIRPLGRQDLERLGKAAQVWFGQVTKLLNESPIVASLSGDTSHTVAPDPAAAPAGYSQVQVQQIVDLLVEVRAKQNVILDQQAAILTALAQPIGS